MTGTQLASSIKPGSLDQGQSERALRRIKEYLMRHPEAKTIEVGDEVAGDDALVLRAKPCRCWPLSLPRSPKAGACR